MERLEWEEVENMVVQYLTEDFDRRLDVEIDRLLDEWFGCGSDST